MLFSTSSHPQTEVTNRTLTTILRAILRKNLKLWEEALSHVEFAYNRTMHSSTKLTPFEYVYSVNPLTPLDLTPYPMRENESFDAGKHVEFVKELHDRTRQQLMRKAEYNANKANKGRRLVTFQPGDLVWVHLRKERFPNERKSKLAPRGDGPFKVLQKVGDNAYKLELLGTYDVSATFNVADLIPYLAVDEDLDSWLNPFQEGEVDA